ncbi:MAG: 2-amino-4-hydroxy-6-hydroxymethyldihydropteridine diphosphokinase [Actinomycetota bacterium]
MRIAYIGIGSNVGERTDFVRRAVQELESHPDIKVEATSSLYETSPIGGPPQRSFINAVARIATDLDVRELFEFCKETERRLGREPNEMRWGPRVVDLDLLLYDQDKVGETDLEVPHPRMRERRFVLIPLLEIDHDVADPWGTPYRDSLDEAEGEVELSEPF